VKAQEFFRQQAVTAETYFDDSLRIFTNLSGSTPLVEEGPKKGSPPTFRKAAGFVISVVVVVYVTLSAASCLQLVLKF
jgi:hypothetical protein